ncbi:TPA: hypothetical protein ACJWXV_004505, partial [Salmonella enterica subsp. enterica serovar Concord]
AKPSQAKPSQAKPDNLCTALRFSTAPFCNTEKYSLYPCLFGHQYSGFSSEAYPASIIPVSSCLLS